MRVRYAQNMRKRDGKTNGTPIDEEAHDFRIRTQNAHNMRSTNDMRCNMRITINR